MLDTILPVPVEWLPVYYMLSDVAMPDKTAELEISADTMQRPMCWDMARPSELMLETFWPRGNIKQMARFLENDPVWRLDEYLKAKNAADVVIPDWTPMLCEPGSRVKVVSYRVPVPSHVPKGIRSLLQVPETVRLRTAYYYRRLPQTVPGKPAPVVLVWQTLSKGAPLCDKYCIQGSMVFTPGVRGGVQVVAWSQVRWVSALPWGMYMVKGVVEMAAKKESLSHLPSMAAAIGKGANCC